MYLDLYVYMVIIGFNQGKWRERERERERGCTEYLKKEIYIVKPTNSSFYVMYS